MVFNTERMGAGETGRKDHSYTLGPIGFTKRINES